MIERHSSIKTRPAFALVLVIALVVLAAFSAVAGATEPAQWTVGGKALVPPAQETVAIESGPSGPVVFESRGLETIECEASMGATVASGETAEVANGIKFWGCKIVGSPNCQIKSTGGLEEWGTLQTQPLKGRLSKVWTGKPGYSYFVKFTPAEAGGNILSLRTEPVSGKSCGLSGLVAWRGSFAAQLGQPGVYLSTNFNAAAREATLSAMTWGGKTMVMSGIGRIQAVTGKTVGVE
jgi:hypothetical protein